MSASIILQKILINSVQHPDARILVFCRAPIPGQVKTRLAKSIGDDKATRCHQALATHCLQTVAAVGLAPVQLWCSPDTGHSFFSQQKSIFPISLHQQSGQDLGERMSLAFDWALADAEYALVIGTDCPALHREYILQALQALKNGASAVIGPAEDGGYVLLGLHNNNKDLFKDMPWGSGDVFEETRRRLGSGYEILPTLWDIDVVEDFERLKREFLQEETGFGESNALRRYFSPES